MSIITDSNSERQRQQRQQQEQQQIVQRSRWLQKLLAPNPDIREFLSDMVYIQAVTVAGTEAAAFLIEPGQEKDEIRLGNVAHIRPDQTTEEVKQQALKAFADIIGACVREGKDGAVDVGNADLNAESQYCLVTLLRTENSQVVGATAVITRCRDESRARQRLEQMQLVAGYFDFYLLRRGTEQLRVSAQNHQDVLQYATALGTAEGFQNAVNNVCNEIAARTGATRVSLGWVQGIIAPKIKLKGLSHTEQFDKKQEMSVQLVRVMEECYDQEETVQYDPSEKGLMSSANVTREAASLSRMEGGTRVTSLPLRRKGEIVGVMTLEFPPEKTATDTELVGLAVAAELLGPPLYDRHYTDRWLFTKAGLSTRDSLKMLLGPKYWLAKLLIASALIGLWVLGGAPVPFYKNLYAPMHHVKAPFAFAPIQKRLVSMPFDGKLVRVHVLPGAMVEEGQLLAELDTREVEAKRIAAIAQRNKAEKEMQIALNQRDENGQPRTAEAKVKEQDMIAAQAEIDLYDSQLQKSRIVATMSGEVLQQDLRERINDNLKQGDQLFEIAPIAGNLRIEAQVADRDIERVIVGRMASFRTKSRPDQEFSFKVEQVVPAARPEQGNNVYLVYGSLDSNIPADAQSTWRPGMKGEVAIEDEPKPLLWQWTKRLVEWVRLKLWI